MRNRRKVGIALVLSVLAAAAWAAVVTGRRHAPVTLDAQTPAVHLPPLLVHLPGVGGTRAIDQRVTHGIVQGGFAGEVRLFDWTGGDTGLHALRHTERNRGQASQIADQITARYRADPTAPIDLICHSGGAGLAVWALADLPGSVRVSTLVFMSPALSPRYDLSDALRHVAGHAYVFYSEADEMVLGYGTRVFGTIDGVQTDAAGKVGFTRPPGGDEAEYAKLVQFPYQADWSRFGDAGDHVGGMTRSFGEHVLAPLFLTGRPPPP